MADTAVDSPFADSPARASVRVRCGARLHFGLLDTAAPFGGIGVMIEQPKSEVVVTQSEAFDPGTVQTERITSIAERIAAFQKSSSLPQCSVRVNRLAHQHHGLGSGTQLSLAVAEAIARVGSVDASPQTLVREFACRSRRSAVGSHGYFQGGLIYESGHESDHAGSLQKRIELPRDWSVIVLCPDSATPIVSGQLETTQFDRLPRPTSDTVGQLKEKIDGAILPAAVAGDFDGFAAAVTQYNAMSGELFRSVQGGAYNGVAVTSLIEWLRDRNVAGYGQSSWGPGVFAWFETRHQADVFVRTLPPSVRCLAVTSVRNSGRDLDA